MLGRRSRRNGRAIPDYRDHDRDRTTVIKEQPWDTDGNRVIKEEPDDGVESNTVIHHNN
jgi:hypothetical protein